MSLSKPIINLIATYIQNLYLHPIRTKSITSAVIGASGSYVSQLVAGERINIDAILSFGIYGLLFGGTVPHYFYMLLERIFPPDTIAFPLVKHILFERLIFAPFYQAFTLYVLARLEGKNHEAAIKQLKALYWPILEANWKILTFFQVLNLAFVPPVLRVLSGNCMGFFWAIYLAKLRRKQSAGKGQ